MVSGGHFLKINTKDSYYSQIFHTIYLRLKEILPLILNFIA